MLRLILAVIFAVVVGGLMIYTVYDVAAKKKRAGSVPENIELKNRDKALPVIYIFLSLTQMLLECISLRGASGRDRVSYILLISVWTVFLLYWLTYPLWTKAYLTAEGVIITGGKNGLIPAEEWKYEVDDCNVQLYRNGKERPAKYKADDTASLEKMLTGHYIKKI